MTRLTSLAKDLAVATGFLTRYPIPAQMQTVPPDGARAAWAFPLAAVLAALLPALVLPSLTMLGAGPLLAALIAIAVSLVVTGALHEDGLADSFDGLFGGQDRAAALAIMKDSSTGAYGTIALILSILLQAVALAVLVAEGSWNAALFLIAGAAGGRAAMVCQWSALPSARTDGAASALGRPGKQSALCAVLGGGVIIGLSALATETVWPALAALVCGAAAALGFSLFVARRLGGCTGDTLGATARISETVFLVALAICV
ncbi:adenosylcobinamide-GDP ribazoletransferase [Martelella lutilitoris]|uniref:Adenosylcobinamide-GDP ribazoletransferase n=1 Tax=Martelella lutilitoris TaxID=2583532 RepID=A0A7T7HHB5_9HYPH|nr:adenosylcobinamide-GDP ribazoletransferase [Martelella lutilitoris]QQM29170.1 adenosylcobinamide-GDP ribazoletransferase [Martelella lutilitoris]